MVWKVLPHSKFAQPIGSLSYRGTGIYFTIFIWHSLIIYRARPKYVWDIADFIIYDWQKHSVDFNIISNLYYFFGFKNKIKIKEHL